MRRLGSISEQTHAEHVTDYLLTLNVHARAEQEDGEWAVWVLDEEKLDEAREVFKELKENPNDERLKGVAQQATALREAEIQRRREAASNVVEMRGKWNTGTGRKIPITFTIIAICVGVALFTEMKPSNSALFRGLQFVDPILKIENPSIDVFANIRRGEIWRLISPVLMHFGTMHIVFNMYMLYQLGGMFEQLRGSRRFLAFVIGAAAFSNIVQMVVYELTDVGIPLMGGFSGVDYALFGYVWMKSSFDSSSGFRISPTSIIIFVAYFFLCFSPQFGGWITGGGGIANGAHAGGMLFGIVVGYAPTLWKDLTRK